MFAGSRGPLDIADDRVTALTLDVTNASHIQRAVEAVDTLDVLINNAGILRDKSFAKMDTSDFRKVVEVHLMGSVNCTRAVWPHMAEAGYGRILMTTSTSGIYGNFGQANYAAAKSGLVGLMNVLAIEGAKKNIKVNAIAPTAATRMTEDLLGPAAEKLSPELVTPIVTYLAHEDCSVTGEVYSVGGGRVARVFVGVTPGHFDAELSPEGVRDNLDKIRDESGYELAIETARESAKGKPEGRLEVWVVRK